MFFKSELRREQPLLVTKPWLPPLDDYVEMLKPLWESRKLTNHGDYARRLENQLETYCEVEHCRLVCNGTAALLCAIQALKVKGEIIVTPATFVATTNALQWTGSSPVFCDIGTNSWNIDPVQVEAAITPRTEAILAVHLYGYPCAVDALQSIADKHGLALIYDGSHTFGCRHEGKPLISHGDASTLSFHATKPMTTIEGGAVVTGSREVDERLQLLRDFGFDENDDVLLPGLNAKMNEFQAAMGLLQLRGIDGEIAARRRVFEAYTAAFSSIPGLHLPQPPESCDFNYSYVPVRVRESEFGASRDELDAMLQAHNIFGRKYFTPLNSELPWHRDLPSAQPGNLPNATAATREILCFPIFGDLELSNIDSMAELIQLFRRRPRK